MGALGGPQRVSRVRADPGLVQNLMEMGFSRSQCKAALKDNRNNFERALDKLLNNGEQYIGVEDSDDSDGGNAGGSS